MKKDSSLEELQQRISFSIAKLAVLSERNRILEEIRKADLPVGIWAMIKHIILPDEYDKYQEKVEEIINQ